MKKIQFVFRFILCVVFFGVLQVEVSGQDTLKPVENINPVEVMPEYPGGMKEMRKFLARNIVYPKAAMALNIQGKVFVSFVIGEDGSISDAKSLRSVGGGIDEEAVRVISLMPKWKPGFQDYRFVKVRYTVPITFSINQSPGFPSGVLLLIDGNEISEVDKRNMSAWIGMYKITEVQSLKPRQGAKMYGEKGKKGAVIVTTKK